jgi:hypothetical protein
MRVADNNEFSDRMTLKVDIDILLISNVSQ